MSNAVPHTERTEFVLRISGGTMAVAALLLGPLLVIVGVGRPLPLMVGGAVVALGLLMAIRLSRAVMWGALAKWGIVLAACVVTLLLLEIGLRIFFAARSMTIGQFQPSFVTAQPLGPQFDRRRFISHPFLPYAPRPNDARTLYIPRVEIQQTVQYDYAQNSLGFRTPERPFAKPPNTKRIVTLGGSTTWDGQSNDQTWPALLERKLNVHYQASGYSIEVINLAVDGYSSPMSLGVLELIGLEFAPDLIISYDGINDLALEGFDDLWPDYRTLVGRFDDQTTTVQAQLPSWAFRSYLITLASRAADSLTAKPVDVLGQILAQRKRLAKSSDPLAGMEYFERNLRLMRASATEYHAQFAASTAHWVSPSAQQVSQNARLREFFARERVTYLDADVLLPHGDWSLHVDQVHWTSKGLDLLSDAWTNEIVADDLLSIRR